MTYQELLDKLKTFTPEQLAKDVKFYNNEQSWFWLTELLLEPCTRNDGVGNTWDLFSDDIDPDQAWFFGFD